MHDRLLRDDICLTESLTAQLLVVVIDRGASLDIAGIESQVAFPAQLLVKSREDSCGFVNRTGADAFAEHPR